MPWPGPRAGPVAASPAAARNETAGPAPPGARSVSDLYAAEARALEPTLASLEAATTLVGHLGAPELADTLGALCAAVGVALTSHLARTEAQSYPDLERDPRTGGATAVLRWQHARLRTAIVRLEGDVVALRTGEPTYRRLVDLRWRLCGLAAEIAAHLDQEAQVARLCRMGSESNTPAATRDGAER